MRTPVIPHRARHAVCLSPLLQLHLRRDSNQDRAHLSPKGPNIKKKKRKESNFWGHELRMGQTSGFFTPKGEIPLKIRFRRRMRTTPPSPNFFPLDRDTNGCLTRAAIDPSQLLRLARRTRRFDDFGGGFGDLGFLRSRRHLLARRVGDGGVLCWKCGEGTPGTMMQWLL